MCVCLGVDMNRGDAEGLENMNGVSNGVLIIAKLSIEFHGRLFQVIMVCQNMLKQPNNAALQ